ncbi:MAG: hypothetical protein CBC47_03145 [Alphaproteobacteria bacterium TMED87]|nr:cysteine desulfuration protein SufE [Rhodospirillaceae bacterium]OUV10528.1 MAG: hypothetical protein CBC47_03145 [Alphaproteobacteria bacterium TMED87]|tara:strand:- start:621 stop:1064 length:444 start_codon:yes stop_codon:yes gene_type:complete
MNKNLIKDIEYIYPSISFDDLVSNFNMLNDFEDRYSYIIELGQKLPILPDFIKTDQYKVEGCMSQVWMIKGNFKSFNDRFAFAADSDSSIVKGLIFVLATIYTGKKITELSDINEVSHLEELGLQDRLSVNRRNGFAAMIDKIRRKQ